MLWGENRLRRKSEEREKVKESLANYTHGDLPLKIGNKLMGPAATAVQLRTAAV